jgi:hypothetical protein
VGYRTGGNNRIRGGGRTGLRTGFAVAAERVEITGFVVGYRTGLTTGFVVAADQV